MEVWSYDSLRKSSRGKLTKIKNISIYNLIEMQMPYSLSYFYQITQVKLFYIKLPTVPFVG